MVLSRALFHIYRTKVSQNGSAYVSCKYYHGVPDYCSVSNICRSRFYSCNIYKPSLTVIDRVFSIDVADPCVVITEQDACQHLQQGKVLESGCYRFTANDTYFRVFETVAITSDKIHFDFLVDTPLVPGIFPSQEFGKRTITLVMQVT